MKKPTAILVGDIHYRDTQPACRLDDFWETQKRKALWLRELWEELGRPPVLQPGDLFHHWKSSPRVISAVLEYLPPMITMPGNPGKHNYQAKEGFERDALYTVWLSEVGWHVLQGNGMQLAGGILVLSELWGTDRNDLEKHRRKVNVLLTHKMILDGPAPFDGEHGLDFLKRNPGYDLILTGHNHKPMIFVHNRRFLVNPGSFTRQTADEDHLPRVYLWYGPGEEPKPVYVPIEEGVITREHLDKPQARDERIVAFVESLAEDRVDSTVRFVDNMMRFIGANPKLKHSVLERLLEAIDGAD